MFTGSEYVLLSTAARTAMKRPLDGSFVERSTFSRSKRPAFTRSWKTSRTWSGSTWYCCVARSFQFASVKFLAKLSETRRDVPARVSTRPVPLTRTDSRRIGSWFAL